MIGKRGFGVVAVLGWLVGCGEMDERTATCTLGRDTVFHSDSIAWYTPPSAGKALLDGPQAAAWTFYLDRRPGKPFGWQVQVSAAALCVVMDRPR